MKKLYFLDEEEKQRILNIHESATKRQYLSEQSVPPPSTNVGNIITTNDKSFDYKLENGKYFFKGKGPMATKYPDWREAKVQKGIDSIKALFDKLPKTNTPVVKTDTTAVTPVNTVVGGDVSSDAIKKPDEVNSTVQSVTPLQNSSTVASSGKFIEKNVENI